MKALPIPRALAPEPTGLGDEGISTGGIVCPKAGTGAWLQNTQRKLRMSIKTLGAADKHRFIEVALHAFEIPGSY
jgi:hypothetical protein